MPNGNTLICEGAFGRIFEVGPTGKIVWEFVNFRPPKPSNSNRIYRAHKVPLDWY